MIALPKGWAIPRIDQIAHINPRHPRTVNDALPVTFVRMAALSESSWKFESTEERSLGQVRKGFTHFAEGDVLFAKITPCMENGKAAVALNLRNGLGCGTTELHVMRPLGGVDPKYLFYFIHQECFREEAARNFTGTAGQLRVPTSFIKEAQIPLPSVNEQRRIVAKLEKLLSRVNAAQERLATIPRILKRFRQSVLAAACSGRLTSDWRKKHSTTEFLVTERLTRLLEERLATAPSVNQQKTLRLIYDYKESNQLDNLPDGWRFVALDKLCERFDYGTSSKSQSIGRVPVLRMGNIQNGEIDWRDLVYTSDEREIAKYTLEPNTVLFNRTNSPELVGKTAIYRGERPAIFAGYLIRIKNYYQVLDSAYLNYSLNTEYAREFCLSVKADGVSQSNINAQKLAKFEVPFCSLTEQQEIVRRVEALFKTADALEARYLKAKAHVDRLTQSILAKAFRGELVPQDPNDEPASVLLERITAERNGSAVVKRRSRK